MRRRRREIKIERFRCVVDILLDLEREREEKRMKSFELCEKEGSKSKLGFNATQRMHMNRTLIGSFLWVLLGSFS